MGREVFFFPPISDAAIFQDICCRATWALTPWIGGVGAIRFWTDLQLPEIQAESAGFDPTIATMFETIKPLIRLSPLSDEHSAHILDFAARVGALVFVWRLPSEDDQKLKLETASHEIRTQGGDVWNVDPIAEIGEGENYLLAGAKAFGVPQAVIMDCRQRLQTFAAKLRKARAYIVAEGQSLDQHAHQDLSSGDCIVSGAIIPNADLMKKFEPVAAVACDPVSCAGPSRHAANFRSHLLQMLESSDAYFFTTMRDYHHYLTSLPARFHSRVIALDALDADSGPASTVCGMLALGGEFHERITAIGCDSSALDVSGLEPERESREGSETANLQVIHPAYFKRCRARRHQENCRLIAAMVDALELVGKRVDAGTQSDIPALRDRQQFSLHDLSDVLLVSINPDAKGPSGHWVGYDDRLAEVCRRARVTFVSLGNRDLDLDVLASRPHYRLAFEFETWGVGEKPIAEIDVKRLAEFEATLVAEVDRLIARHPSKRLLLYMYTGSLPHAAVIYRVIARFPAIRACVNTFWTCVMDCERDGYIDAWGPFLAATSKHPRFRIFSITPQLKAIILAHTRVPLPLLPHPSPAAPDPILDQWPEDRQPRHPARRVLFPGGTTRDKGFSTTAEVSVQLARKRNDLSICVRASIREGSEEGAALALSRIAASGVEVIDRSMDDREFVELIRSADLVVLPYDPKAWRYRNSGLGVDAISAGVPIVCFADTWLGDIVSRHQAGLAIAETDPAAVVTAIEHILANYNHYRTGTSRAAHAYCAANNWSVVADAVFSILNNPPPEPSERAIDLIPIRYPKSTFGKNAIRWAIIAATTAAAGAIALMSTVGGVLLLNFALVVATVNRRRVHRWLSQHAPWLAFVFRESGKTVRRRKMLSAVTGGVGIGLLVVSLMASQALGSWIGGILLLIFVAVTGWQVFSEATKERARRRNKVRDLALRNDLAARAGELQARIDGLVQSADVAGDPASTSDEKPHHQTRRERESEIALLAEKRAAVVRRLRHPGTC